MTDSETPVITTTTPNPQQQQQQQTEQERVHEQFLKDLGTVLSCAPDPYSIAAALVNSKGNFHTAAALMFGLSWSQHKDWLMMAANKAKEDIGSNKVTAEWLGEYAHYYVSEVATYPEGA